MKMQDLENLTIAAVAPDVERRKISPVELTRLFLARIERLNPVLNAYVTITAENALAQAQRAEDEIAQGNYRGALHGIPFSIKDNIATHGVRTTAGSKVLENWVPDFDATVVTKLKEVRSHYSGQNQSARMGPRRNHDQPILRHDTESVGPQPNRRRVERRLGCRSSSQPLPRLDRYR